MTIYQSIILGILQGLTEFLPISSSGHLVLLPYFLNWELPPKQAFIFDVLVQMGTLVAVVLYFRKDLSRIISGFFGELIKGTPFSTHEARLGWLLIIATIPAGLVGVFLKDLVEKAFSSPLFAGIGLLVTAALLLFGEKVSQKLGDMHDITVSTALVMGAMQALSLFPGISRSGATISGGMARHLKRVDAGRFSFLMSIPIMVAAGSLSAYQMITEVPDLTGFLPIMAIGFFTSMVVGYIAIRWLLKFIVNHSLSYFAIYCLLLGSLTILTWVL